MANIVSSKKRARQAQKRHAINLARKTSVKSSVKRVLDAIKEGQDQDTLNTLFNEAQAKLARAKGKGLLHANTAARKIGRLAKKVNAVAK